jgi:8-oxo-dGTP diphosphatase
MYNFLMADIAVTPERFAVLATDVVLFTIHENQLLVRLMSVHRPPYYDGTAGLPGGLIDARETAEEAARRHVEAKGKVSQKHIHLEQLYTFSGLERDPRGRVVAVAYIAAIPWEQLTAEEQANTDAVWWEPVREARNLAYDHDDILKVATERLASRITYTTLMGKLMGKEFTLTELEQAYESVLRTELDKRNFRKKILKLGIVKKTDEKRKGGSFRPAQLYTFSSNKVYDIEVL